MSQQIESLLQRYYGGGLHQSHGDVERMVVAVFAALRVQQYFCVKFEGDALPDDVTLSNATPLLPDGWDQPGPPYKFKVVHLLHKSVYAFAMMPINVNSDHFLHVEVQVDMDNVTEASIDLRLADYISGRSFAHLNDLQSTLSSKVRLTLTPILAGLSSELPQGPSRVVPQGPSRVVPQGPSRVGPQGPGGVTVGEVDLQGFSIGRPNSRGLQTGGSLMGPRHPVFGDQNANRDRIRFDPFDPLGGQGDPNPDLQYMPGFGGQNNMYF